MSTFYTTSKGDIEFRNLNRQVSISQTRNSLASLMGSKNTSKPTKHAYNLHFNAAIDVNRRFCAPVVLAFPWPILVVVVLIKR